MTSPDERLRNEARRWLEDRRQALREDIQRELRKYDSEHYDDLADKVADSGEKSVAFLLVDLDLAEISRDVHEFREVEDALSRLDNGTWGTCSDCGEAVDAARLEALPSAARCLRCQDRAENPGHEERHRSL